MSKSNQKAKRKLILKFGEVCFLEELKIRDKEDVKKDIKRYTSKKQQAIMDQLTYHHIVEKSKGRKSNRRKWSITKVYKSSMV